MLVIFVNIFPVFRLLDDLPLGMCLLSILCVSKQCWDAVRAGNCVEGTAIEHGFQPAADVTDTLAPTCSVQILYTWRTSTHAVLYTTYHACTIDIPYTYHNRHACHTHRMRTYLPTTLPPSFLLPHLHPSLPLSTPPYIRPPIRTSLHPHISSSRD